MRAQEMIGAVENKIIPPSPSSSVFKKYMGEQPSLATGAVNVTIPLYEIHSRGVSIPFTLRYNTNGIKVFDDPNPCGFGWSLHPGMRIMRTIMGRPDELFDFVGEDSNLSGDYLRMQRCMTDSGAMHSNKILLDSEHDIFTFCLLQGNYTYILDKEDGNMNFVGVGSSEYKIETDSLLTRIYVTDSHGIKYEFGGAYEMVENYYKSAWMLTAIHLLTGETITLEWESAHHGHPRHQVLCGDYFCDEYTGIEPKDTGRRVISSYFTGNRIDSSPYYLHQHLKKVSFPGGTIELNYLDNGSGPAIETLAVKNETETVKSIQFEYGGADRPESYLLKQLHISGEGNYHFEYNPQRFVTVSSLDYWGYYNGHTTGYPSLVPQMKIKYYDPPGAQGIYVTIGHADRSIDREKMQANILTKVTYPTGGETTFEYEPHRFNNPTVQYSTEIDSAYNTPLTEGGGLRVTKITTRASADDPQPIIKRYVYGEDESGLAECIAVPDKETFISQYRSVALNESEGAYPKPEYWFRRVDVNIYSNYMDRDIGQTPIWYKQVTEYSNEGKREYRFADMQPKNLFSKEFGRRIPIQLHKAFSKGPLLIEKKEYKQAGTGYTLTREKEYNYRTIYSPTSKVYTSTYIHRNIRQTTIANTMHGVDFDYQGKVITHVTHGEFDNYPQYVYTDKYDTYQTLRYIIDLQTERLMGQSETIYTDNGSHTVTESYEYLDDTGLISRKSDDRGTLEIYYPHTAGTQPIITTDSTISQEGILLRMNALNMKGVLVYTRLTYKGETITAQNLYSHYGNRLYIPYRVKTQRGSSTPVTLGTYNYNTAGNLISYTTPDGVTRTYQWGYDNCYPVQHTLGGDISTTYSYTPLVGMTSAIDPRGIETTYSYDNAGRLIETAMTLRGTIAEYGYHNYDEETGTGLTRWNGNYVTARQYLSANAYIDNIEYVDGLGRPTQNIKVGASPDGSDIATLTEYNNMSRPIRTWHPVPLPTITTQPSASTIATSSSDFYDDDYGYEMTEYEASPSGRATSTIRAGAPWHTTGKATTIKYLVNDQSTRYHCRQYSVTTSGTLSLTGNYATGELMVTETTDEDNQVTIEFKDRRGLTVLTRRMLNSTTIADCYYVYDNYGDLRYVIPPMLSTKLTSTSATWTHTNTDISRYGYYYSYDSVGKCIYKKLPGRGAIRYKYDAGHRLVAEQDGNMQSSMQWLTHFYDKYGREVITGIMNGDESEIDLLIGESIIATLDGSQENYGYSFSRPLPLLIEPFTAVNYYDNYDFIQYADGINASQYSPMAMVNRPPPVGLLTGALTFTGSDSTPLLSVSYYDMQGNEVERHSRNHSGGMEHEKRTYSFTSQPLTIERVHTSADGDTLVSRRIEYHYDHADRLTSITHQVNDHPETTISQVSYDAIGRRHTQTTGALTTTYSHDVHGWLTKMENSRFVQELLYTTGATPCYNGNISSMLWRGADGITRRYDYSYDGMSRLIDACYSESGRTAIPGLTIQGTPDYSTSYSYDLNGNPTQIYRKGIVGKYGTAETAQWNYGTIDNITFDYDGNQQTSVEDSGEDGLYESASGFLDGSKQDDELEWDANGNLLKDKNRSISAITYDLNNNPQSVEIKYGDYTINYLYNSSGIKQQVKYGTSVTVLFPPSPGTVIRPPFGGMKRYVTKLKRDYYGEDLVYRNDTLEMVLTDVGYVDASGNYHYYVLDYQGNVRQVADAQGNVIEQNDYYPYGGLFGESASRQSYKYSGKELEKMNGLNTYDFHARPYYYPVLQFHSPDLLSENTPWLSPYLYCAGNPIMYIDPTGMECWWSQMWDDYNMPTRLYGAMKAAGGITEATVGATAGVATSWTGVGAVLGGAALVHGCDVAASGITQMISGEETSSLTSQGLQAAGVPKETAERIDVGLSIGFTFGSGIASNVGSITTKVSSTSTTAVSETGTVSKTGGRLGNQATRAQNSKIAQTLEDRGYIITGGGGLKSEEYLAPLSPGREGGSYIDITAKHPRYGMLRINTVDVLKDGVTPTARELRNAERIRKQIKPEGHLLLIPKNR